MNEKVSQFNKMVIMHLTNPDRIVFGNVGFSGEGKQEFLENNPL